MNYKLIMIGSLFIILNIITMQYIFQNPDMLSVMLGSDYQLKSPSLFYAISVLTILIDLVFFVYLLLIGTHQLTILRSKK
ncbi:TPA: hypothetical protein PXN09_000242 [Yersinia enterocolitica]|nr:hypothetical protein [Yersinia enterocolitica]HDL7378322.1 hypothetical protein [Yersinia enterocolitica]